MPRTIAVGDIHGCSAALDAVLAAVEPTPDDTVVVLGDAVDCGMDTKGVLDRLVALGRSCHLVFVRGNHEELMLDARSGWEAHRWWVNCGGQATLDSYGFDARLGDIPARHWRLLEGTVPHFETDTHLFVHANYLPDRPLEAQPGEILRWRSLADHMPGPHISGKVAVVGHTPQPDGEVLDLGHLLCIDTHGWGGGWLTAVDVGSGRAWQADERGRLRE